MIKIQRSYPTEHVQLFGQASKVGRGFEGEGGHGSAPVVGFPWNKCRRDVRIRSGLVGRLDRGLRCPLAPGVGCWCVCPWPAIWPRADPLCPKVAPSPAAVGTTDAGPEGMRGHVSASVPTKFEVEQDPLHPSTAWLWRILCKGSTGSGGGRELWRLMVASSWAKKPSSDTGDWRIGAGRPGHLPILSNLEENTKRTVTVAGSIEDRSEREKRERESRSPKIRRQLSE